MVVFPFLIIVTLASNKKDSDETVFFLDYNNSDKSFTGAASVSAPPRSALKSVVAVCPPRLGAAPRVAPVAKASSAAASVAILIWLAVSTVVH